VFTTGQSVGHYEILEKLGEGGMGIVYKARDTRLNRLVALKLLTTDKLDQENQLRRFGLEARTASALNHPNIITIFDICSEDATYFIAMEYVGGKTLDQVIPRKGMRVSEALKVAIQITDALSAAERAGIIHRDLKPSNIMVAESGLVKVLDFGLAKLADTAAQDETVDDDLPRTVKGTILGTTSYMSPEQAEGKPLDSRSDIFSFGSVLYEMLTGRRAFGGETGVSTISSILRDEPQAVSRVARGIPRDLEQIVNRCLRKDPNRRFQTISDVRIALLELKEDSESGKLLTGEGFKKARRRGWVAGGSVLGAFVIAAGIWLLISPHAVQVEPRAIPFTNYPGFQGYPAFSPDGKQVAFAWTGGRGTVTHIYVKIIGTDIPLPLTSGEISDTHPVWAANGKSIAYIRALSPTTNGIYQIAPLGGHERYIAELPAGLFPALSWSRDGRWLVTSGQCQGSANSRCIFIVSAEDGNIRALSFGHANDEFSPALSPDSQFLAFSRRVSDSDWGIFVVPVSQDLLPTGLPRRLRTPSGSNRQAVWTADGKDLIVANGGTVTTRLWRVPVDSGNPVRQISIAGEVAYQPAVSPVEQRLAYAHDFNNANIWRVAITPGGKAGAPVLAIASARSSWIKPNGISPDGRKIAFESNRSGPRGIWVSNTDGSDAAFLFGGLDYLSGSPVWSPDGRWIAFDTRKDGNPEIYLISADGGAVRRLTNNKADDMVPCWSHDGKSIYFDSNRTGRYEVFKISPEGGAEVQVTHNGGWAPQESPDGKFLFYTRSRAVSTPLFKISTEGGDETQILPSVRERWWAVGNEGIWWMRGSGTERDQDLWLMESAQTEDGDLRFLSFATGAVTTASALKNPYGGVAISPDGGALLFNQIDHRATEILLVDNFR
jgi:Tol biopolymer transport system component/tRNA A-37 threonylcarbamoyl transferase component Bud32